MRLVDIQLSFPAILIALILLAILGKGVDKVVIALVSVQWAYYARTIRGSALVERRREYIEAAQCLALPQSRIIFRHLLPNAFPPLIVVATVQVAHAIALEATLSFLGVGVPITEPSLGLLIANGYGYMLSGKYWIAFYPGHRAADRDRGDQPGRRPAARRDESAAETVSGPDRCSRFEELSTSISSPAPASSRRSTACRFAVGRGEVLGLVGESGSGKTVTGLSILGLVDPPGRIVGGSIRFEGEELVGRSEEELRALRGRNASP